MRQDDGGDLGEVHVAAAAESEHGVGPKFAAARDRRRGGAHGRLRFAAGEHLDHDARFAERNVDRFDESGLDKNGVGDEQDAADSEPAGDVAELLGGVPAENQLAGGVERPGGAHEVPP